MKPWAESRERRHGTRDAATRLLLQRTNARGRERLYAHQLRPHATTGRMAASQRPRDANSRDCSRRKRAASHPLSDPERNGRLNDRSDLDFAVFSTATSLREQGRRIQQRLGRRRAIDLLIERPPALETDDWTRNLVEGGLTLWCNGQAISYEDGESASPRRKDKASGQSIHGEGRLQPARRRRRRTARSAAAEGTPRPASCPVGRGAFQHGAGSDRPTPDDA